MRASVITKFMAIRMRNDLDELTNLNRDYVNSVQNSDVKRFDEILARRTSIGSNRTSRWSTAPDFLKQTAIPVTIKNLESS